MEVGKIYTPGDFANLDPEELEDADSYIEAQRASVESYYNSLNAVKAQKNLLRGRAQPKTIPRQQFRVDARVPLSNEDDEDDVPRPEYLQEEVIEEQPQPVQQPQPQPLQQPVVVQRPTKVVVEEKEKEDSN